MKRTWQAVIKGFGTAVVLAALTVLSGCGGDDCGDDGDCGDNEVCTDCDTLADSCKKCVEIGETELCSCTF